MDQNLEAMGMLDLMIQPGFCVKDQKIVKVNAAARSCLIEEGIPVSDLLYTGTEEYADFSGGCLYLCLRIADHCWGASVSRLGDSDVFILEQEADQRELQAMALAAKELRESLTNVMTTADRLFPMVAQQDDPILNQHTGRLNRGLFQMLRVISNMSDAGRYSALSTARQETHNITAIAQEIFDHAQTLVQHTGLTLSFENLSEPVYTLADREQLERAIMNLLSNAIKFTPSGGRIDAKLSRRNQKLYLSVQDSGQGIPEHLRSSVHSRYLRQPGIEDSRFGIGLGMVLIRGTAASHGGTVLIDHPENSGTRITMTLAIRQNTPGLLRSGILRVDYAGERDHGLIELSDVLPAELYDPPKKD